jgi:hypothetical protein
VINWLVIRGLRERGGHNARLAEGLRRSTLDMIEQGADAHEVRHAAMRLMEANSVGEEFTTPSRRQYRHGWLWDSAIAAMSWPLIPIKPELSATATREEDSPAFCEYFHPNTGQPLGAPRVTWTASLYLELLHLEEAPE